MGIGKAKSDNIDIDSLMGDFNNNKMYVFEDNDFKQKIEELKNARLTLEATVNKMEAATIALHAATNSAENIVTGICNAIVKAEQNTQFKANISPEQLVQLQQLLNQAIETWKNILENHRSEQTKMLTDHESNIRKILKQNEGIWFSDFWMKFLVIFLFVYTVGLGVVVYCLI